MDTDCVDAVGRRPKIMWSSGKVKVDAALWNANTRKSREQSQANTETTEQTGSRVAISSNALRGSSRQFIRFNAHWALTETQILDPVSFDMLMPMLTMHAFQKHSRMVMTRTRAPLHLASTSNTNSPPPNLVRTHVKQLTLASAEHGRYILWIAAHEITY